MEILLIGLIALFGLLLMGLALFVIAMHARMRRLEDSLRRLENQPTGSARGAGRTPLEKALEPRPTRRSQPSGVERTTRPAKQPDSKSPAPLPGEGAADELPPESAGPPLGALEEASSPAPGNPSPRRELSPPELDPTEKAPPLPADVLLASSGGPADDPLAESSSATPKPRFEWEKWVGVRGAALLGGILLALAGLLFFQHSLEQGWVSPTARVISGTLFGLAALFASDLLRRRDYKFAPAATAGAGIVILYATTWASYGLYEFISVGLALPLMGALTFLCAWLALRLSSQFVAVLGLVGGFATPLLLSMPADQPLGLFGYLLLLDLGLLAVGSRLRSSLLATLGMLATFIVQFVWIVHELGPEDYPLALASLGVFGMLFAIAGQRAGASERGRWLASQVGALLLPFGFAIYFSSITDLGEQLWPLMVLAAILGVGATWIALRQNFEWLAFGAAFGALATVATWIARSWDAELDLWQLVACGLGVTVVFLGAHRFFRPRTPDQATQAGRVWLASGLLGLGLMFALLVVAVIQKPSEPWPWLVGLLGHAFLLHLQGRRPGAGLLRVAGSLLASSSLGVYLIHWPNQLIASGIPPAKDAAWVLGSALFFLALGAWSMRADAGREARFAWHAAALYALGLLLCLPAESVLMSASSTGSLAMMVSLALIVLVAADGLASGAWALVMLPLLVLKRWVWISATLENEVSASLVGELALLEWLACALLVAAPLVARGSLGASRLAWLASGLLVLLSLFAGDLLLGEYLQQSQPWGAAGALALMGLGLGVLSRWRLSEAAPLRDHAARCLLGPGAVFSALALARFLDHQVFVISAALAGLFLAMLWRRLSGIGLKLAATGLVFLGAFGLLVQVSVSYAGDPSFENGAWLVWNWSSYATAVPATGAFLAACLLRPSEGDSPVEQESKPLAKYAAWPSQLLFTLALLLSFLWLNLQVLTYFETEDLIRLDFASLPARDLTLSISWILFALLLLAGGMLRNVSSLRQASLVFLLLTLIKLFLHDLGDLSGLYRVGSILGLAISLLLVSLLYQRFVFPRKRKPETDG